ncbi:MAG: phytanoyl-CoA dioxygenase family protein [Chthonomonadales bacterium]|nr:phytanoyl-CoA dioxygenase family protein [Chthonomonadales bacterium]
MRTEPTPEEIAAYRDDGFVVLHGFLEPAELEEWRAAVEEAVAARQGAGLPGGRWRRDEEHSDDYYERVFVQRVNLWMDSPRLRGLLLDERIGRLAADLAGVGGVRIWHDQALIKPPWANPTAWHLDAPYWSFSSRDAISLWLALDDATVRNGCMYFLPGTHRRATYDNVSIGRNLGALFGVYPDWASEEPRAAEMRAGSCSFHNGLVAHAAGPNMTPRPRRAMTCGFMPDGATFNGKQNILSDAQVARLTVGDPLTDERQNPLVFSRGSGAGQGGPH